MGGVSLKDYHGSGGTTTFTGFKIANGYTKNFDIWKKNSRVKLLRLDSNGKSRFYIQLADSMNARGAVFPYLEVKGGDVIRITIEDVYPGTKYTDTCISELISTGVY
ncbi:MAG: NADase-type glycan-binding domain-containing protein [Vulcanimicrobiota bacterium]